eukprot:SAG22_NODE_306_length_12671_cov_14.743239_10_plen_178_part_00
MTAVPCPAADVGTVPWDGICIDRADGFKWHSSFAGLFFMLYLLYMARVTLHCAHLRAALPPAGGGTAAVSDRSMRAKLAATAAFFVALLVAANLSGPWASRKKFTATCEWVAALCVQAFVLSTASDYGPSLSLDALLDGDEGPGGRAREQGAPGCRQVAGASSDDGLGGGLIASANG